jgi:hypothetical protein
VIAALGGIWLVRNWVESGNPLFPVRVRVLGVTVFDAPFDLYRRLAGFTLLHYAGQPDVLRRYAWPAFNHTFGVAWLVLAAGALLAAARGVGRGLRAVDGRVLAAVVCVVLLGVAYVATPYSALGGQGVPAQIDANTRYLVPALLLAAALAAWTSGRLGRWGTAVDLAGLVAVADGLRRWPDLVRIRHVAAAAVVVGVLLALAAGYRALDDRRRRALRAPRAVGVAAGILLVVCAAGGYAAQRRFFFHRYRGLEPPLAFVTDQAPRRVGVTGLWNVNGLSPVFPAFGPRLRNRVEYVGPFRDGMLVEYRRREPFVAALRRGRYDLLVVGLETRPVRTGAETWARSAGYREVGRSGRLVLFAR